MGSHLSVSKDCAVTWRKSKYTSALAEGTVTQWFMNTLLTYEKEYEDDLRQPISSAQAKRPTASEVQDIIQCLQVHEQLTVIEDGITYNYTALQMYIAYSPLVQSEVVKMILHRSRTQATDKNWRGMTPLQQFLTNLVDYGVYTNDALEIVKALAPDTPTDDATLDLLLYLSLTDKEGSALLDAYMGKRRRFTYAGEHYSTINKRIFKVNKSWPLTFATATFNVLKKHGYDVNKEESGGTILHRVLHDWHVLLNRFENNDDIEFLRAIISKENVRMKDAQGRVPLWYVVQRLSYLPPAKLHQLTVLLMTDPKLMDADTQEKVGHIIASQQILWAMLILGDLDPKAVGDRATVEHMFPPEHVSYDALGNIVRHPT